MLANQHAKISSALQPAASTASLDGNTSPIIKNKGKMSAFLCRSIKHLQRLIFAPHPGWLWVLSLTSTVFFLKKKEKKVLFYFKSSFFCTLQYTQPVVHFFLKQKLECEKTCMVHVWVLCVKKFDFPHTFALLNSSLQQTCVFPFVSVLFFHHR